MFVVPALAGIRAKNRLKAGLRTAAFPAACGISLTGTTPQGTWLVAADAGCLRGSPLCRFANLRPTINAATRDTSDCDHAFTLPA